MKNRAELLADRSTALEAAKAIADAATADNDGVLTDDNRQAIAGHLDAAKAADAELKTLDANAKADADLLADLATLGAAPNPSAVPDLAAIGEALGTAKTLGQAFTAGAGFKTWLDAATSGGGSIPKGHAMGTSAPMAFGLKDLITGASDTSAGALVNPDFRGLLDGLGAFQRPLTVLDLITKGTTMSDLVSFVRMSAATNNAAMVPEATTRAPIGSGSPAVTEAAAGLKPHSGFELETVTTTVRNVAHLVSATKRAIADAGQVATLIDNFLRYGLADKIDEQVINGNGTGEEFPGILNTEGLGGKAWDTDLLTTTRKARTLVRTVGRATPTAWLFHPADNERIDLIRNENGDFYFGGPTSTPSAPLWGLPRVESESVPEGTGLVGDFRTVVMWDREQATVTATDAHEDYFARNLVALRAEARAALGVVRPSAIVEIEMAAGS